MAGYKNTKPKRNVLTDYMVAECKAYFLTVKIPNGLTVISDGRSGNGHTHWSSVHKNNKLVACISQHDARNVETTIAINNSLRNDNCKTKLHKNLKTALQYLITYKFNTMKNTNKNQPTYNYAKPTDEQTFVIDVSEYILDNDKKSLYKQQLKQLQKATPAKYELYDEYPASLWSKLAKLFKSFGYVQMAFDKRVHTKEDMDEFGEISFIDTNACSKKCAYKLAIGQKIGFQSTPRSKVYEVKFIHVESGGDDRSSFLAVDAE